MMDAIKTFYDYVGVFFILYMVGYASFLFLAVAVGSSTLYQLKRRNLLKNELLQEYYVPVTIVVPAYNEEVTIVSTIRSLLSLEYKLYESSLWTTDLRMKRRRNCGKPSYAANRTADPQNASLPTGIGGV